MKIRNIREDDLTDLRELVEKCAPLDFHTLYTYWVIVMYFAKYSYVMEAEGAKVGFVTSMRLPEQNALFIWQIGLFDAYRGKGLSKQLLNRLYSDALNDGITSFQFSIDPENKQSKACFTSFFRSKGFELNEIGSLDLKDRFMKSWEFEVVFEASDKQLG